MKQNLMFLILFILTNYLCNGQNQYPGGPDIPTNKIEKRILIDSASKIRYVIDSTQTTIVALDYKNKVLWVSNPNRDNKLGNYRTFKPRMDNFGFKKLKDSDYKEVIFVIYNNTQFGFIDKLTGKFTFLGQD
jgi:hypothetical protein